VKHNKTPLLAQIIFIIAVVVLWQILYSMEIWPKILFPSIGDIGKALVDGFVKRNLGGMVLHSLKLLLEGLVIGLLAAVILSSLAVTFRPFYAIYNMVVSMMDLIPGVALIPIAILWLGIGDASIIFMVIHSVIWPMSRSTIDGFNAIPNLYIEVGKNIGMSRAQMISGVFLPATLPRIFSGIKVGWARAWRGLISAEMIFGGGAALGIGYFITDRRTNMDISGVFAAIIVIIVIGIIIEYGIFRIIENKTFKRWGMAR